MKKDKLVYEQMSKQTIISTFGYDYWESLGIPNDDVLLIIMPNGKHVFYGDKRPDKQFVVDFCKKNDVIFICK